MTFNTTFASFGHMHTGLLLVDSGNNILSTGDIWRFEFDF
jgi:hypothetical protein